MSEATRLEQTIQQEELRELDLTELVRGCVEGYRTAHADRVFELRLGDAPTAVIIRGSPELLAQLLDKLIDNALDFAQASTVIEIELESNGGEAIITIANQGPPLPQAMQGTLFESMVSVRQEKSESAHLGLGLYIARLIAEFHNGRITGRNRTGPAGVIFEVSLPRA
jgi:signal transduction histidine kinase